MSKRPPLGKLALTGKCSRARQLLERELRERDRRDLLSLVGKNSSLAVSSCSGQDTPSRNERYASRVASAEKAHLSVVNTDIRAHGITDVAEKIVFDGDGGKPKPPSELDVVDEESDSGTEDDADIDDSSGSSGSSGGGMRMRSERAARDAVPLVTLPPPVPDVIGEVFPEFLTCCVDTHCRLFDDQMRVSMGIYSSAFHVWQTSGPLRKRRWPRRMRWPVPPARLRQLLSSLTKSWRSYVDWRHSTAKLLFSSNVKNKPGRYVCIDGREISWRPRKKN